MDKINSKQFKNYQGYFDLAFRIPSLATQSHKRLKVVSDILENGELESKYVVEKDRVAVCFTKSLKVAVDKYNEIG